MLQAGGARNAVDCALWELEANRLGVAVWELAGLAAPRPLVTTFTLGADTPDAMVAGARKYAQAKSLKLKLTGDLLADIERVKAVRAARPEVWMGVDANQGYTIDALDSLLAALIPANVSLLEQPLKRGREADLDGFKSKIPIAADESVLSLADIAGLVGRFDVVNIKLDKCGGLTEGLAMAHEARAFRTGRHGGQYGGHESGDGARIRARTALRRGGPGRSNLPGQGPHAEHDLRQRQRMERRAGVGRHARVNPA